MIAVDGLKELASVPGPCLSIFQPLRDEFSQVAKADTRLRAATQKADALLVEKGFDAAAREEFLRPIFKVAGNTDWTGRTGSMVVFRAPDFTLASFWPDTLDLRVHLGDEFFVLPLVGGLRAQRDFWILALSVNRIALFRGSTQGLSEVPLPKDLPRSLAEAGGFDPPDHDLESRSSPGVRTGQTAAVRSGTTTIHETRHQYLHDFFRKIDRAIQPILADSRAPLILAAVSRELTIYREANTYPVLLSAAIQGSPDVGAGQLHKKALELVAANSVHALEEARREMDRAAGRGLLLTDPAEIEQAAGIGQIERLFFRSNAGANEDRINKTALAVIRDSGTVVSCELPQSGVAAILRYRATEAPLAAQRA